MYKSTSQKDGFLQLNGIIRHGLLNNSILFRNVWIELFVVAYAYFKWDRQKLAIRNYFKQFHLGWCTFHKSCVEHEQHLKKWEKQLGGALFAEVYQALQKHSKFSCFGVHLHCL